jgi:hypothetical protein
MEAERMAKIVETGTLSSASMGNACIPKYLAKPIVDRFRAAPVAVAFDKEKAFLILDYMQ